MMIDIDFVLIFKKHEHSMTCNFLQILAIKFLLHFGTVAVDHITNEMLLCKITPYFDSLKNNMQIGCVYTLLEALFDFALVKATSRS